MENQLLIYLPIIFIWLVVVSIVVYRMFALFRKLTKGVGVTDLKKVLEKVISDESDNRNQIKSIIKQIQVFEDDSKYHIQKVSLVRFNPFKELGGDHSFSLALLDNEDTGVIITSLHTRDRTRVYVKEVKEGKSRFELSADEKKALLSAKKIR